MGGIVKGEGGILLKIGGMPDHIHMIIKLKPSDSVSYIMQKVKGNSSKWINETRRTPNRFRWQNGYGAFTVSESRVPAAIRYVEEQENHHKKRSFRDEFVEFLQRHHVEYDERYLWTE
jgi:REP element-mobilizing transposase RayT